MATKFDLIVDVYGMAEKHDGMFIRTTNDGWAIFECPTVQKFDSFYGDLANTEHLKFQRINNFRVKVSV